MSSRQSKFLAIINNRVKVMLIDGRMIIGTFLAFDKHMNLVLSDSEEYTRIKSKNKKDDKERKRVMGLLLVRGDNVLSMSAINLNPEEEDNIIKNEIKIEEDN